jgi:hypothetical protein
MLGRCGYRTRISREANTLALEESFHFLPCLSWHSLLHNMLHSRSHLKNLYDRSLLLAYQYDRCFPMCLPGVITTTDLNIPLSRCSCSTCHMCCEDHPLSYPNMALCNPLFYHLRFLHGTFYSLPYAYYSEKNMLFSECTGQWPVALRDLISVR